MEKLLNVLRDISYNIKNNNYTGRKNEKEVIEVTKSEGKKNRLGLYIGIIVSIFLAVFASQSGNNNTVTNNNNSIVGNNNTITNNNTIVVNNPVDANEKDISKIIPEPLKMFNASLPEKPVGNSLSSSPKVEKVESKISLNQNHTDNKIDVSEEDYLNHPTIQYTTRLATFSMTDFELKDIVRITTESGEQITIPQIENEGVLALFIPSNCKFLNVKLKNGENRSRPI